MKNRVLILSVAGAALLFVGGFLILQRNPSSNLVSTKFSSLVPGKNTSSSKPDPVKPLPSPTPTPVVFHFDKSTDLKNELEQIDPQVKNSDFQNLDQILSTL